MFYNFLPADYDIPPTIYSILNSIVNYGKPQQVSINELAKAGASTIFNFNYPLSSNVNKEDFEVMILNHFMMRRIGFETVTAFSLMLNTKLNEIMPHYNQLFDYINEWSYFNSGEKVVTKSTEINNNETNATSNLNQNSENMNSTTNDNRYSSLPNNQLEDVKNGSYVTDYTLNQTNMTTSDTSSSNGKNDSTFNGTITKNETIEHSPSDKMRTFIEAQNEIKNIYSLIFRDLESLFFQIV